MGRRIAVAVVGVLAVGCSRLQLDRPSLVVAGGLPAPTTQVRTVESPTPDAPTPDDLVVTDLPPGWHAAAQSPPNQLGGLMPRVSRCLGVKLAAIAGGALRGTGPVFASSDEKEWVTASVGAADALVAMLAQPPSAALMACVAQSVELEGVGARRSPPTVTWIRSFAPLLPHSLDVRVTSHEVIPNGIVETSYVDLVWIADDHAAALFDVVDLVFPGDLPSADDGLIAQVTDAVGRRIAGD